jgi:hypothetical protein
MVIQNPELSVFLKVFRRREIWGAWEIWLLQLVVYWPVALSRRKRNRAAPASQDGLDLAAGLAEGAHQS